MARRAARVDANQRVLVVGLRELGYKVLHLHTVGGGCPDILIMREGKMLLVEIKTPEAFKRKGQGLTSAEVVFLHEWEGVAIIGYSVEQIHEEFTALHFPDR